MTVFLSVLNAIIWGIIAHPILSDGKVCSSTLAMFVVVMFFLSIFAVSLFQVRCDQYRQTDE